MQNVRRYRETRCVPVTSTHLEPLESRRLLTAIVVNTASDTPVSGHTTLRQAVQIANSSTSSTTITFDASAFATMQTITLAGTQLELTNTAQPTTIIGPSVGVKISANNLSRLFQVDAGVTANFSNLTIADGNAGPSASGGGLRNSGTLTISHSTFTKNQAYTGGGLANYGTATLTDDTFTQNSAAYMGGGIDNPAAMSISNSTLSANSAEYGGGLHVEKATTNMTNCTVANNTATNGGGIAMYSAQYVTLNLYDSTIYGNSASGHGGGLLVTGLYIYTANIGNTVIAGNIAVVGPDVGGLIEYVEGGDKPIQVFSQGNNFIGKANDANGWVSSDQYGSVAFPLNAKLGALANNGGAVQTMAPQTGSPLIDKGSNALIPSGVTKDARELTRVVNGTVDIGAVEVQASNLASISGVVFSDANSNGKKDSGEVGIAGVTLYNDANNNSKLDSGERTTTSDSSGNYLFSGLSAGSYKIRQILPSGYTQVSPTNNYGQTITLSANQTVTGKNFADHSSGVTPPSTGGSISGTVFNDLDGDGVKDSNEIGVGNITIYNDANNNSKLDAGEITTVTSSTGAYMLANLAAGSYKIREILQSGWSQTTPANNYGWTISLASNQQLTGKNFGTKESGVTPPLTSGSISGFVFNDNNKNGAFDAGDVRTSGKTVFLDANNNGKLDSGEKSVVSDANGNWSFGGLSAGTYHVRRAFPSGYTYSTTLIDLTLNAGDNDTGLIIGSKQIA